MGADREVVAPGVPTPGPSAAAVGSGAPGGSHDATAFVPAAAAHASTSRGDAPAHAEPSAAACANCGASVAGHFCSNCGQRVEHSVHSVWHFAGEAFEDLTHADSRLWSTIGALLFKPGFLTCEFLAGRRVKYLPPLRLYLVLSLLFFVVAAYDNGMGEFMVLTSTGDHAVALQPMPLGPDAQERHRAEEECNKLAPVTPWGGVLRKGCLKALEDNGRSVRETFMHNLPRAIFVSLPILALVLKPLYKRPRRYYVEHLLFLVHDHAFLFLWLGIFSLLQLLIPVDMVNEVLLTLFALYLPYYYFRALRRVYGDGPWLTFGKFTVLSLAYLVVTGLLLLATGLYSVVAQGA